MTSYELISIIIASVSAIIAVLSVFSAIIPPEKEKGANLWKPRPRAPGRSAWPNG